MSKTLITDTLDKTVRSTGFKETLRRNEEVEEVVQAEQDRIARIEHDNRSRELWLNGRVDSLDLIAKTKEMMTEAADNGKTSVDLTVAEGKETAYDRGMLDGIVTWLKYETFKFEVFRSKEETQRLSIKVSW